MTILYITEDGITDHIGRAQVAPYLLGLARLGFDIHILSAEKLGRDALIEQYLQLFQAAGIAWTRVRYRNKPRVFGHAWTATAMKNAARRILQRSSVTFIHCRSVPAALIAYQLKPRFGVRYIFDFRHFYADEGIKVSRGLSNLVFRRLKQLEGPMIRHADKVVCLTQRATQMLCDWYFKDMNDAISRFQVIPCCADFDFFDSQTVSMQKIERARAQAGIKAGDFVLLYLGSLGSSYLLPEMMALFSQVLLIYPNAYFLFVSNNGQELVDEARKVQQIDSDRIRFVSVDRCEVPSFIALAHLSVIFIQPDLAHAGCSPTKLAELFACNVPVIANTGVGDLDAIIELSRNGSVVVDNFDDNTLKQAILQVMAFKEQHALSIRDNSREFALEEGIARYARVYQDLLTDCLS
jgi:glycosyltransferase involved in cell wall biosynthesis